MPSFNHAVLAGHLTRDVEVRYLQNGTAVCDLGLAVNDRVKKNNDWVDEPLFIDVTLFGKVAEVAGEYLSKGAAVLVSGRLKLDQLEADGQKRSKVKMIADKMQMLGGRRNDRDSQERQESPQEQSQVPPDQDSIPF